MKTLFFREETIISRLLLASIILSLLFYRNQYVILILVLLLIAGIFFYRDKDVAQPIDTDHYIYAASYGKVLKATDNEVTVYLDIMDPHVQKIPTDGTIIDVKHIDGEFNPALFYEKTKYNERIITRIQSTLGHIVQVTQIAGQLTRRIVAWVKPNDKVITGNNLGMIKFGSSVRVQVPNGFRVLVKAGEYIIPGETKIFRLEPVATF